MEALINEFAQAFQHVPAEGWNAFANLSQQAYLLIAAVVLALVITNWRLIGIATIIFWLANLGNT